MKKTIHVNFKPLLLVSVLCLAYTLSFLYYFLTKEGPKHPFDFYLMALCVILCLPTIFHRSTYKINLRLFDIALLSLIFFFPRFYFFGEMEIWLDEYSQYLGTQESYQDALLIKTFVESQPPFDYFFTNLATSLFGKVAWALKFFPLVWGYFSLISLHSLGLIIGVERRITLILASLFMSHPLLIGYHLEGRPYSLGLFTSILLLLSYLIYLKEDEKRSNLSYLFVANILCIFSIGLQPLIFIFSFSLPFIFLLKKKRDFILTQGLTLLLALPQYYFLFSKNISNHFSKIDQTSKDFLRSFLRIIDEFLLTFTQAPLFWTLLLVMSFILFNKEQLQKIKKNILPLSIFLLTYSFIYTFFINWNFHLRYILLASPLATLFFLNFFRGQVLKKRYYLSFIILIFFLNLWTISKPLAQSYYFFGRKQWKETLTTLDKKMGSNDEVMILSLCPRNQYKRIKLVGKDFYATNALKEKEPHNSTWNQRLSRPILSRNEFDYCQESHGSLFIIYEKIESCEEDYIPKLNSQDHQVIAKYGNLAIGKTPIRKNLNETLQSYFTKVIDLYRGSESTFQIQESLYFLEKTFGKRNSFETEYFYKRTVKEWRLKEIELLIKEVEKKCLKN